MKTHVDISKRKGERLEFSESSLAKVKELMTNVPEGKHKTALIRVLHMAQSELGGWLSIETMDYVAELLNITPIEVYEVATFYTMFHLDPTGKYVLEVCRTGPCMLVGSDKIIEHIEKKLDIKVGETSSDGMFTLKTAECLGACGYGPMLQCHYKNYEFLTPEKVDDLLDAMRNGNLETN
ncbi:MAG: NADH-quinone oxidoreductase subunit NuoE [Crocinitomicaceae bacterium]